MKRVLLAGGLFLGPALLVAQGLAVARVDPQTGGPAFAAGPLRRGLAIARVDPRAGGGGQFPGGTNPDGSLRPSAPLSRLFTQDAYTEYALLEPGSEAFRITFLPEETRVGATELINATRGGSEGTGIEVYDPRTGLPLKFTYEQQETDPTSHAIRATLPRPVPAGGVGRVLIYKTYKDPRTYMTNGKDIVWVRSLSGYRLGVVLPKGFALISSNVAAQLTTTADGRLKLAFANPSGQASPVTIHARPTAPRLGSGRAPRLGSGQAPRLGSGQAPRLGSGRAPRLGSGQAAAFAPGNAGDMFFDDIKTLYDLDAPETGRIAVEQIYSDYRKGDRARLDSLAYLPLQDLKVVDLDTAQPFMPIREGRATFVKLDLPITSDRQSAHLKITGTLKASGYTLVRDELVFQRMVKGLRNTVLLPTGWEVSAVSESATIGTDRASGRAFVSLINLNAENSYRVTIRARKAN